MSKLFNFWQGLPKSRQPGQGKKGANSSYDHLQLAIKDPLIPLKLQFFEGIASKLNSFLIDNLSIRQSNDHISSTNIRGTVEVTMSKIR